MCGDPRVDAVKAAAKATTTRKEWLAWQRDKELAVRHTATVHARWVEQWPTPEALAVDAARAFPLTKASRPDQGTVAAVLAWLWQHLKSGAATVAAFTAALTEARQLGRASALHALTAAGLTTPTATQALDALETAQTATTAANAAGTLAASIRARVARIAAGIAQAVTTVGVTLADLTARIRDLLTSRAWLDTLTGNEIWRAINDAASTVYGWAMIRFASWQTADDGSVCAVCDALEAQGPQPVDSLPDAPEHPRCRCAILPAPPPDWVMPAGTITDLTDLLAA